MVNKVLLGIFFVFLVIVGVELFILFSRPGADLGPKSATSTDSNTYYPLQTGLMNSYLYPFELRGLPITKSLTVSSGYEGVVDTVNFEKDKMVVFKFTGNDVWVSFYKKPSGFQETKCQVYDKTSGSFVPYTFSAPPFKKGDKVAVTLNVDYKSYTVSCSLKQI